MTPKELHQTLAGGGPDPLYLIYGEEDFLVEECVQAVVHHALDEGSRQFNLDILYGSKSSVQEVIAHATAFPMMGERRVTIVRELDKLFQGRQDERERRVEMFASYLERPLESTVLLMLPEKPDFRTHLFRLLKQKATVVECRPLWDREIPGWVAERIRVHGGTASPEAVQLLQEYVGNSLRALENEIEKLSTYLGERNRITADDVAAVVGVTRGYTVFDLQDAIGEKDLGRALAILETMLNAGQNEQMIIVMLTRFNTQLWKLADAGRGGAPAQLAKDVGVPEWVLSKYRQFVRNYTLDQLESNFSHLLEADTVLKSTSRDSRGVLDLLVYAMIRNAPVNA